MKYTLTLELFDEFKGRRGQFRKLGTIGSECDIDEVSKSLDVAIRNAEGRLGLSSGEADMLRKMKELFLKQNDSEL